MPLDRKVLSRVLNRFFASGLGLPVRDLSSGFRIYRTRVLRSLACQGRNFDVLEEILVKAYAEGWRLAEIPFTYYPRESGSSHARVVRFGVDLLRAFARCGSCATRSTRPTTTSAPSTVASRSSATGNGAGTRSSRRWRAAPGGPSTSAAARASSCRRSITPSGPTSCPTSCATCVSMASARAGLGVRAADARRQFRLRGVLQVIEHIAADR